MPLYLGTYSVNGYAELAQTINDGVLSTDIRDGSNNVVASPSFSMNAVAVSTSQQVAAGTLGTASQRLSVDNPSGAHGGFSLTLNATTPGTGTWSDGVSNTYAYNGATAANGQLNVDPDGGAWVARVGTTASFSKGTLATFTGSTPITLVVASDALEDIWNGYVTGIGLTQSIPAGTPSGNYSLSLTQTVVAL